MPLIDILNHHTLGASFSGEQHGSRNVLAVRNHQPVKGSNQCFAVYGVLDPMDTFIRYNFIDREAFQVRSVPLTLEVGDLGVIEVRAAPGAVSRQKLPAKMAGLRRYLPIIGADDKDKKRLTISHLLIPVGEGAPLALRRVLAWVIGTLAGKRLPQEKMESLVLAAEEQVLSENRAYYRDLLAAIDSTDGAFQIKGPLRELAMVQLDKLEEYQPVELAA